MSTPIQDSIALVTGANRGIGRSIVEALLARGAAKVYAAARNPATLADLISAHGSRVVPLTLDVTDPAQISAAATAAADATLIINNAGVMASWDLFGEDIAGARQEFEVNYWGTLHMIRAFVPALKTHGGGTFVNLSSIAGLTNFPAVPTYSDSKAAVHSLTVGARLLLAKPTSTSSEFTLAPLKRKWSKDIDPAEKPPARMSPPEFWTESKPEPTRSSPTPWPQATPVPTKPATKPSSATSLPC